jgi:hypothetical protein
VCVLALLMVQAASSLSNAPKFSIKSGSRFAKGCNGAEAGGARGAGGGGGTSSLLLFQELASASGALPTAYGISNAAWSTAAWHHLGARAPPIRLVLRGGDEGEEDGQEEETEVSRLVSEAWSVCGEGNPLEAERLFHEALRKVGDPAVSLNLPPCTLSLKRRELKYICVDTELPYATCTNAAYRIRTALRPCANWPSCTNSSSSRCVSVSVLHVCSFVLGHL